MNRTCIAAVGLVALAGAAQAADMPAKAPFLKAPPPAAYNWTGLYVGGFYGTALGQSQVTTPSGAGARTGTNNVNQNAITVGITAGYNWQVAPNWLIGVEGDIGYVSMDRTFQEWDDVIFSGEKADWLATARARFGYLTGPSLLYVTGGAAFVHTTDTFGGTVITGVAPATSTTTRVGWTAGGGIDTKLSRSWSAKTEYLFVDAGSNSFTSNPFGVGFPATTTFTHQYHIIKTGLTYSFGGPYEGLPFFTGKMLPSDHNWAGFYVGVNAGGGMSATHAEGITGGLSGETNDVNGTGFAAGIQAGYNYFVTPKYFVGVEGDVGYLGIRHSQGDWFDTGSVFTMNTNWYGTMRARVGTSTGPALLYVTGGAAFVGVEDGFGAIGGIVGDLHSTTRSGWTFGGGTEVALGPRWSAKIESLYIDTGTSSHVPAPSVTLATDFKERFAVVRAGLNYKLGPD